MKTAKAIAYFAILVLTSTMIWAATPSLVNYQGRVLDGAGNPLPDANYDITFTIYDAAVGGLPQWSETQTGLALNDGFFSTVMGAVMPLSDSVFGEAERYLEISIAGQAIFPRTQFTSTGYSYRTSTVDGATAGELSGALTIAPSDFLADGNAITVVDANDAPVFEVAVDAAGLSTVSFYEPSDSKIGNLAIPDIALSIAVNPDGSASMSFFEPVDSKSGFVAAPSKAIEISVDAFGLGSVSFFEPVDSKSGLFASSKKVEMHKNGLIMFGATDQDTSLIVAPNGDIIGLGQITMGQNSSSGVHTSVLGFDNDAAGDSSTIGGGSFNVAQGAIAVISGGHANLAASTGASIGGGAFNEVNGEYATIGGGQNNFAQGNFAVVPGGRLNQANGIYAYASGYRAFAQHNGTFVWADQTDEDFASTAADQFIIRASGGVGIGTNSPTGLFDVVGTPGDQSVNLPDDAISASEIFDEPGIASSRTNTDLTLLQGSPTLQDVVTTTITIPSSGYITVNAGATIEAFGSSGPNQVFAQIDETANGTLISPYYAVAGSGDHDSPNSTHYHSINVQRIYFKAAGTYQFRFEAQAHPDNGGGAVTVISNAFLTATYFPTSYGAVSTSSSSALR